MSWSMERDAAQRPEKRAKKKRPASSVLRGEKMSESLEKTRRKPEYVTRYVVTIQVERAASEKCVEMAVRLVAMMVVSRAEQKRPRQRLFVGGRGLMGEGE